MLSEEAASDAQLKGQFGERWTRTPSEQLTVGIRAEAGKYRTIINNAIAADAIVKEKFAKHKDGIMLLSQSEVRDFRFQLFQFAAQLLMYPDYHGLKHHSFRSHLLLCCFRRTLTKPCRVVVRPLVSRRRRW